MKIILTGILKSTLTYNHQHIKCLNIYTEIDEFPPYLRTSYIINLYKDKVFYSINRIRREHLLSL